MNRVVPCPLVPRVAQEFEFLAFAEKELGRNSLSNENQEKFKPHVIPGSGIKPRSPKGRGVYFHTPTSCSGHIPLGETLNQAPWWYTGVSRNC